MLKKIEAMLHLEFSKIIEDLCNFAIKFRGEMSNSFLPDLHYFTFYFDSAISRKPLTTIVVLRI